MPPLVCVLLSLCVRNCVRYRRRLPPAYRRLLSYMLCAISVSVRPSKLK
jgi:NADPH-dependent glutamate synthase beta subunit-like oxidoreductase